MKASFLIVAIAALSLSGCGGRGALKPAPGESMPPKPAQKVDEPDVGYYTSVPVQARPSRSADIYDATRKRQIDQFDLPPDAQTAPD